MLGYLKGSVKLVDLPEQLRQQSKALKNHLNEMKTQFKDLLPEGSGLRMALEKSLSEYMRKSFAIFTDPTYRPDDKAFQGAVKYISNLIKNNRDLRVAALDEPAHASFKPDARIKKSAEALVKKILHEGKTNNGDPLELLKRISKTKMGKKCEKKKRHP